MANLYLPNAAFHKRNYACIKATCAGDRELSLSIELG
jgi:hypothetical protein